MPRGRFALAAALALLALPLGGCESSRAFCGVPILDFLFCDPGSEETFGGFDQADPPVADFTWAPSPPQPGQQVTFRSTSRDPDGFLPGIQSIRRSEWDLDGDGTFEATSEPDWTVHGFRDQVTTTYPSAGQQTVRLRVTDWDGLVSAVREQRVTVGDGSTTAQPGTGEARPPSPGGRAAARRRSPPHRILARFSLQAVSAPASERRRARRRLRLRGVRVRGQLTGQVLAISSAPGIRLPPPPRQLVALLTAPVSGRLEASTDRRRARQVITGVAVGTLAGRRRGRVCFALRMVNRRGRVAAGTFRILGGSGAGAGIRGSGRVKSEIRTPTEFVLGGTVRTSRAPRGALPRRCRAALRR